MASATAQKKHSKIPHLRVFIFANCKCNKVSPSCTDSYKQPFVSFPCNFILVSNPIPTISFQEPGLCK